MSVVVDATLQIGEIHRVAAVVERQRTLFRPAADSPDVAVEAAVDRRLDEDLAAWRTERPQRADDGSGFSAEQNARTPASRMPPDPVPMMTLSRSTP